VLVGVCKFWPLKEFTDTRYYFHAGNENNASSSVKWAFSCQISKGTLKTLQTNEGRRWGGRVQGMIQANEYNYCSIWHRSMQFFIIVNRKMSTNAFWYASRLKIWMKIPQFQDV